ncbi:MAG: hypothetical protein FJX54_08975 [Alphaproteobacteria bacterium]|nr:hypothetical protein [Alphaproteobacteria bacterium]
MATAHQILLAAIEAVLGPGSDAGRYLARAMESDDALDLLLAEAAFQDLDDGQKKAIAARVDRDAEQEIERRRHRRR